jgi:hypothetical protein
MTEFLVHSGSVQGDATVEESELVALCHSLTQKLEAASLGTYEAGSALIITPFLTKVAKLQESLLSGIKKIMEHQNPISTASGLSQYSGADVNNSDISTSYDSFQNQQLSPHQSQNSRLKATQYDESLDFPCSRNSEMFDYQFEQPPAVEDWLWDMVMNDGNMFTL